MVAEAYDYSNDDYKGYCAANIDISVKNHLICFAAEKARHENTVESVDAFLESGNCLVNPFVVDRKLYTQFTELRRHFVARFAEEKTPVLADSRYEGVHPYVYKGERETVVMLVNATLEQFDKTAFFIKVVEFDTVLSVDKDGVTRNVSFAYDGDMLVIDRPLEYMSSRTFRLVKSK